MVTADELLGAPLSVVVCEPFQSGCILVPLATWFLNLVQALFLQPSVRTLAAEGRGSCPTDAHSNTAARLNPLPSGGDLCSQNTCLQFSLCA